MPDFTRPHFAIPDRISAEDLPRILRQMQDWMASQVSAAERRVEQDPRFSDERVSNFLRVAIAMLRAHTLYDPARVRASRQGVAA